MIIEKQWHQVKNVLQAKLDSTFSVAPDATTEFDSLLALDEINALGYVRNFPHLTCVMCSIEQGELLGFARGQRKLEPDFKQLNADVALLPATCYKIYLGLKGQQLDGARVESCIARCFRHEDKALDSYRAFNFTMKEYVYLGTAEARRRIWRPATTVCSLCSRSWASAPIAKKPTIPSSIPAARWPGCRP